MKSILVILILLGLTACDERKSLTPKAATPDLQKDISTQNDVMVALPLLDDTHTSTTTEKAKQQTAVSTASVQTFTGGQITDGLDMGAIRASISPERTRIVFDTYKWKLGQNRPLQKADMSGHYTFKYDPSKKRITATVNGYRGFSALQNNKVRTFSVNNIVEKIYLVPNMDDSGFKFNIDLKQNAQINVFDIKAPGRIVLDISAN